MPQRERPPSPRATGIALLLSLVLGCAGRQQARATTVRRLLVDRGVDANRIDAVERTARYPVSVVVLEADPRYPTREDLPHGSEAYQFFCQDGTSADY